MAAPSGSRPGGLVGFGILSILVGLFCAGTAGLVAATPFLAALAPHPTSPPIELAAIVVNVLLYAGLAAVFVALGIGSVRAKRWVRPIMLSVAWTWLLLGVMAVASWVAFLPHFRAMLEAGAGTGEPLPPGVATTATAIASVVLIGCFLVLPAVFVWYYQSAQVKAALERLDPVETWTDRCPLPVLGLSLGLGYGAFSTLGALAFGGIPFFGSVLTGLPAWIVVLNAALGLSYLARATYKLSAPGWWGTILATLLLAANGVVTLLRMDLEQILWLMRIPEEQVRAIGEAGALGSGFLIGATVFTALAGVAYMLWIRKHFPFASSGSGQD